MSIIEKALRRVQDPTLSQAAPPVASPQPSAPTTPEPQPRPKLSPRVHTPAETPAADAPASNTALIILAGTLGFTVTLAVLSSLWMSWLSAPRTTEAPRAASESAAVMAPMTTALSAPEPVTVTTPQRTRSTARTLRTRTAARKVFTPVIATPNRFVVSGIAEGRGQSYAVINGKILSIGESLLGATLVDITDGIVRLQTADGSDIALQLPR